MTSALHSPRHTPPERRVVIRPAPRREPPFDDELPDPSVGPGRYDRWLPFAPTRRPGGLAGNLRAMPGTPGSHGIHGIPGISRSGELPDPAAWGRQLLVGMIETASGRRPLHQLAALLSPSVARGLGSDFERAAVRSRPHWLHRAGVRSVWAAEPVDGVAELAATVKTGERVRAIAMRLENQHGRWRCTRLQLG